MKTKSCFALISALILTKVTSFDGMQEGWSNSCVICNWLSYLISPHLRRVCAPSHLRSSHLRSSYPISSHLHHICASSYLRSLFQIFTSSLSPSGLHILKPHLVSTSSDLHHVVALSYLIIFACFHVCIWSCLRKGNCDASMWCV